MDEDVDLTALPAVFHDLIPLIERWAIGDDVGRDEAMQAASYDELHVLVATVKPRLGSINEWLDLSDSDEVAPYLGWLAEASVEAQMDLESRQSG